MKIDIRNKKTGQIHRDWQLTMEWESPEAALKWLQDRNPSWHDYELIDKPKGAPKQREWVSASKVRAFEPNTDESTFTHRWDGFEVVSVDDVVQPRADGGVFDKSTGSDDYGRTTFVNPLLRP